MKDFGKKIISAVVALAMTASMSVYAEAPSSVENEAEHAHCEAVEAVDSAVNGTVVSAVLSSCVHIPSVSTTTSPFSYVRHHKVNGEMCVVNSYTITTTTVCKNCGITISYSSNKYEVHSVCDRGAN